MRSFRFLFFFLYLVMTPMGALFAQGPSVASDRQETSAPQFLGFSDFYHKVLAYYPRLQAQNRNVEAALAREMQAAAGFWPSVGLSADYTETDDPVGVFGMLLRQEEFTSGDFELSRLNTPRHRRNLSGGVHVRWPLFDAMQTIHRVRAGRQGVKAAEAEAAFARMEAFVIAQDAYTNAVTLDRLFVLADEAQRAAQEDLRKAGDLKDKGMILGADYYAARVMLGDITRMRNELLRQKKAMAALMNILMGEPLTQDHVYATIPLAEPAAPKDAGPLVTAALSARPDIRAIEAQVKVREAELSRQKSTVLPSVSAFGSATNDRHDVGDHGGNNFSVGVQADLSLFDPSRGGRIKEAQAGLEAARQNLALVKDGAARDIVQETARYNQLCDNMDVVKGMAEDADEAVALVLPLYNEGRKSIADLLEMRAGALKARQAYEQTLSGLDLSEGRLLFLTGQLDEEHIRGVVQRFGE